MPVVDIKLNVALPDATVDAVMGAVVDAVAACIGQPSGNVLGVWTRARLVIHGSSSPAALVDVRLATELSVEGKRLLCQRLFDILHRHGVVAPSRMFVQISRVPPDDAWKMASRGPASARDPCAQASDLVGPSVSADTR